MDFDRDLVKDKVKKYILKTYIDNKDWELEGIMKASEAAGPLAKWVTSLMKYADINNKIEPLRQEVDTLRKQEEELTDQYQATSQLIIDLE